MGHSVIPHFVDQRTAHLYDFAKNDVPGATDHDRAYWRDISTLDDYHESHLDLAAPHPFFNLYNDDWPILTLPGSIAPAKFGEYGTALDSIVNGGTIITGSTVQQSVVSYNVRIQPGSRVERSVLLPGVRIGRDTVVRNAILDKNVVVADGATVGVNPPKDHRLLAVSEGGITVIGKGRVVVR
jgi:glucose-1-phosphate adenylyltransferase